MKIKKYFFAFVIVIMSLCLFGCDSKDDDEEPVNIEDSLEKINTWILDNVKTTVAESFTLPTTCPDYDGSVITWTSDEEGYISSTGEIVERLSKNYDVLFTYSIEYKDKLLEKEMVFTLTYLSLEKVKDRFTAQFPSIIYENLEFTTVYANLINVSWYSSNQEVLTNEGEYIKPEKDTQITLTYSITDGNTTITDTYEVVVRGKTALDFFNETYNWLLTDFLSDTYITEDLSFPSEYKDSGILLKWSSDNESIISNTGKITKTLYDRYVTLRVTIIYNDKSYNYSFDCKIPAKDISLMTDEQIINEFASNIATPNYSKLEFLQYGGINQSYGYIHFYQNTNSIINEVIVQSGSGNRPGIANTVQYVTVHDTANNASTADAEMHGRYVNNPETETSWHYSVGDTGIYHQIPDDEIAYHAGDGSRTFAKIDTGIKADAIRPNITLDGSYLCINGVKTSVQVEDGDTGLKESGYDTNDINKMGILCEIGTNGNYFVGKTYYNSTYGKIANYGGNRNSIGIESCVNQGSDYATTVRVLAKLVAELCINNNLSVDRVKGHHYFSGKPCPNALMTANYWNEFLNLVALEKFAKENLSNYTFNWESNNTNLLSSQGKISLSVIKGNKLSYSLNVLNKKTSQSVYSKTFETIIK